MNKQEAAVALPLINNYPPQAWLLNNTWDEVEVEGTILQWAWGKYFFSITAQVLWNSVANSATKESIAHILLQL